MKKFIFQPPAAPAKASNETPAHIRQQKSKAALLGAGGQRVSVNLSADAVADLGAIKAAWGMGNTRAIVEALQRSAKRLNK